MIEYASLREDVVLAARRMADCGMVVGSSGNVSARVPEEDRFIITPSSLPYPDLTAEDIVVMDMEGNVLTEGRPPSVEGTVHRKIYAEREDVNAIFHTHSPCATALAAARIPIPAFLEELVPYIGGPVAVSEYAGTASGDLAEKAFKALDDRAAVLLANHGTLCVGGSLEQAFHTAELLESSAQIYILARSIGTPADIPADTIEMQKMLYSFSKTKG
ncbi:class II aldolase/adducin family protein [Thermodesulfobacteriota bacterium]